MKVVAVVGSYRTGGVVDRVVDEILASARGQGAETPKVFLMDRHIEFCRNCRQCTQDPGPARGTCPCDDDMAAILDELESADALVLASPMNFGTVTAVMKRFIERLTVYAWWPWGRWSPKARNPRKTKAAVIVVSSAAPALLVRLRTNIAGLLKTAAYLLGARTVGVIAVGLAARERHQRLSRGTMEKARLMGRKLVAGSGPGREV
jgi:multimeric flavodoxin WrbA